MAKSCLDTLEAMKKELSRLEEIRDKDHEAIWNEMKSTLVGAGVVSEYEWENAEMTFGTVNGHLVSSGKCEHREREAGEQHPLAKILSRITGGRASVEVEEVKLDDGPTKTH